MTLPKQRIYYGWVNLAFAAAAMVATLPGRTQGLGLVTESLLDDFQMDRVTYATINLWATLAGCLLCLPCGRLVDRYGSRIVLTSVLFLLGVSVLVMSGSGSGSLVILCVTITLLRGLGQSALSVVSLALAGKWFARRLNQAMGIYALLVGIGFVTAFPIVGHAVLQSGWPTAWSQVGWAVAALAPVAWIVVRNNPEQEGLPLDGLNGAERSVNDLTLWEALHSPAFWVFALSSSVFGLVYSGISLFNQSILEQRGFDASMYHTVLVISTIVGLATNFACGWAASRWSLKKLSGLGMAVLAAALATLPVVRSPAHVMLYSVAMGAAGGVVTVVFFSVWGQVFGRTYLGRIQGCAQMLTVIASAAGPLLLASALRRTGSYDSIFYILAVVVAILGISSWHVPMPRREIIEKARLATAW